MSVDPDRRVETAYDARYTRAPRPEWDRKEMEQGCAKVKLLAFSLPVTARNASWRFGGDDCIF